MSNGKLTLTVREELIGIYKLNADEQIPTQVVNSNFFSITRTADELSIVCPQGQLPEYKEAELGWRALKVVGPLDFSLTGVLADLTNPLAEAGISIFALSTYNTDYLLVKEEKLEQAVSTLEASGHEVNKQEG